MATGHALDERAIEGRVVRDDGHAAHEVRERGHGLLGAGRIRHVNVANACQLHDLRWYRACRMHEGIKALHDLTPGDARGRNLDELTIPEREARGLGVEHHHVLFEQPEGRRLGALGKRGVLRAHELGRGG